MPVVTTGDDDIDIGANPSAEAEDDGFESNVTTELSLLQSNNNLADMTEIYHGDADSKKNNSSTKKQVQKYLKNVLMPYIQKCCPEQQNAFKAAAMSFVKQLFFKVEGQSSPRFEDARVIRNEKFGEDGDYNGAWMFVFDEDQDPEVDNRKASE